MILTTIRYSIILGAKCYEDAIAGMTIYFDSFEAFAVATLPSFVKLAFSFKDTSLVVIPISKTDENKNVPNNLCAFQSYWKDPRHSTCVKFAATGLVRAYTPILK